MSNTLVNLARVQSTTIGTGTLTLGSAIAGFNTFADAGLTDGQTVTYAIEDYSSDIPAAVTGREIGQGVYSAGTLTRGTVYSSTSGGAKINCTGRQHVLVTAAKEDFDTFLTTAAAAGAYQPLDADLTTLAANITTFGHSLVDDADNTAARTTLGLGTAATQNTGTSGANLPFLNGTNTWSAINEFSTTSSGIANVLVTCVNDDAVAGPFVTVYRNSASPAANDQLGTFSFDGKDSAGNYQNYALMRVLISSPTSASESAFFNFVTTQSGSFASRVRIGGGLYTTNATGGDLGAETINANTLYEGGTSLASKYQGLDSELTAIAGLTSAADRLPYFTGSGTASLATFTTAGRNLVDDADASAQRTTLGLGTAATANTGTSGNNLPFLNGANTWSGVQTVTTTAATPAFEVSSSASFAIPFSVVSTNADALGGPGFQFFRNSASPAANDDIGFFNFRGNNSAAAGVNYLQLVGTIIDHTSGSEDSRLRVNVYRAGAQETAFTIKDGVFVGSPTGFAKGVGTLNAVAVYDDSVLLCAPVEFMKSGTVNTAMWDEYAIDETRPERIHEVEETVEIILDEPVTEIRGQRDGTYKLETITKKKAPVLEAKPVLDDKGQVVGEVKVPKVTRTVTPPQTIKRRNELAHEFKAMLDEGFDPRDPKAYFAKMLADEALPGLKTKANWVPNEESNAKRTNRIILALELQTAAFKTVYEQVEALKAEVASLKKAKP